jgi:hypothetical protein
MSVPRNVLRHVQRSLGGTRLCKDLLVVTPTEHILRCFLLDRTSEKGMYYLWRVVMPLYSPANIVILNYSDIASGEKLLLTKEGLEESVDRVTKIILDGHLNYLRDLRRPKDFLTHIAWMIGNTTAVFRLDLALTHYMLGNVPECAKILEELASNASDQWALGPRSSMVTGLLGDLRTNPAGAARQIEAWERANIESLGLADTVVSVVR